MKFLYPILLITIIGWFTKSFLYQAPLVIYIVFICVAAILIIAFISLAVTLMKDAKGKTSTYMAQYIIATVLGYMMMIFTLAIMSHGFHKLIGNFGSVISILYDLFYYFKLHPVVCEWIFDMLPRKENSN